MKLALIRLFAVSIFLTTASRPARAAATPAFTESPEQHAARIAWWREARFGMFIHFGLYSVLGRGEWVQWNEQIPVEEYARLADQFDPTNFNADEWAAIAKSAGMKYMVLTARHHDGFCLFDDSTNSFTSVKSAAHRDFVAEYVRAARSAGLRVGLYYSPLDWRYPGFFLPDFQLQSAIAMRDQYHRQVEELLTQYGRLDILWFDGGEMDWLDFGGDWSGAAWHKRPSTQHYHGRFDWQHDQVYNTIRLLQPHIIINNRADMPEDFHSREGDGSLGNFDADHPWELCTTLPTGAWGWQPNTPIKSLRDCVRLLAGAAGRDGNLLLNVGPRPDGQIDPPQVARLREIGQWLDAYGVSIYATRGGPFLPGRYGVSTYQHNYIYLHVFNWPGDKLVLPSIPAKVLRVWALTGGDATFNQTDTALEISVPAASRSDIDTVVAIELDQSADDIKPLDVDSP
jgi:alpha-L-fucosidase